MEEMRGAAMAYYANISPDQQRMLQSFYSSIDKNEHGRVSNQEFLNFLTEKGYNQSLPPNLFKLLDKNNDGTLDFEECITFSYMIDKRLVKCDGCGSYLWSLYFLCAECYQIGPANSFYLCCSCYHNRNFSGHVHSSASFLDNYALLRTLQFEDHASGPDDGTRSRSVDVDHNGRATSSNRGFRTKLLDRVTLGWNVGGQLLNDNCSQQ